MSRLRSKRTNERVTIAGGDSLQLEFRLGGDARRDLAARESAPAAGPKRTRVWVAYGAAAVLAAGAGTFALFAQRANKDLDADLGRYPGDRAQMDDDRSRLRTWAGLTDGFAAAAVIAAGVGSYFLLSGPSAGETAPPGPSRAAQISLLPAGAALSLAGTF